MIYFADVLESAEHLLSLSTPPSQPHAPAFAKAGMGCWPQATGMPAMPARSLMATPHYVATMHEDEPQVTVTVAADASCKPAAYK